MSDRYWSSYLRAQRQYDNQCPDDNEHLRECDQCGEEYEYTVDFEGDVESRICPKCAAAEEA